MKEFHFSPEQNVLQIHRTLKIRSTRRSFFFAVSEKPHASTRPIFACELYCI